MIYLSVFVVVLLLVGCFSGFKTLANSFAIALDVFLQSIAGNSKLGITISARAGLDARRGHARWANFINWLFRDPNHCEWAIAFDAYRSILALEVLFDGGVPNGYAELRKLVPEDFKIK